MPKEIAAHPRRHTRFDASQGNIIGCICGRNDSVLMDISMGGACFMLENPIDLNSSCSVELNDGNGGFRVSAKVAWVREPGHVLRAEDGQKEMYTIGIVFINTYNTEAGANIKRLIEALDS
jgi:hypothetical protein